MGPLEVHLVQFFAYTKTNFKVKCFWLSKLTTSKDSSISFSTGLTGVTITRHFLVQLHHIIFSRNFYFQARKWQVWEKASRVSSSIGKDTITLGFPISLRQKSVKALPSFMKNQTIMLCSPPILTSPAARSVLQSGLTPLPAAAGGKPPYFRMSKDMTYLSIDHLSFTTAIEISQHRQHTHASAWINISKERK